MEKGAIVDVPDFIPDDKVPQEQTPPDFIPDKEVKAQIPPDFIPDEQVKPEPSMGQQALTAIEGAGRGLTGGLSDVLASGMRKGASALGVPEKYLNVVAPSPQTLSEHKEEFPVTAAGTELGGNIALISKLPQIGSKAINGMIQMGLIAGGDELSKAMLGQGDPATAVASRIAEEGAIGLLTGGVFGKVEKLGAKSLAALENAKLGKKLPSFIAGVGHASTFPEELATKTVPLSKSAFTESEIKGFDESAFKHGQDFFNNFLVSTPKYIARVAAPTAGQALGGMGGAAAAAAIEAGIEKILPKASSKYIAPAILKTLASGQVENVSHIIDHATQLSRGASKTNKVIEALFKSGEHSAFNFDSSERERERLREFIENGGVDKEVRDEATKQPGGFAKGGQVEVEKPDAVSTVYPEQHILLTASKARVSNYLNSIRPIKDTAGLPFDQTYKDEHKEREYNKALDLANKPLSILKHVKNGTLLPKHMKDFTGMYPELYQDLSNKITSEMMKSKIKGDKNPPYHVRQSLSLFLGSSLEGSLTPMSIQAAQSVFMRQKTQKAVANEQSALSKMDDSSRTPEQSREQRLNKN